MSSSSTNSRLQIFEANVPTENPDTGEDGKCFCGYPGLEMVSWRHNTPGRRFWNCPNSMTNRRKCEYFDWKDPKLDEQFYKDMLLSLKGELDKKENCSELTFTRRKLQEVELLMAHEKIVYEKELLQLKHENEGLKVRNVSLNLDNAGLKLKNSGLKTWLNLTKNVIVVLLVGIVACGMKVILG